MSKTPAKGQGSGTVADQVAEFIGRTMGELLNRKDSLAKQMAEVDSQIADVKKRVAKQFGGYLPAGSAPARVQKTLAKKAKGAKRAVRRVSQETRKKMAESARRRWARERSKKA